MEKMPCEKKERVVSQKDLPVCCPAPDERVWDGHPRVYLDMGETGFVVCPYCETKYRLA